MATRAICSILFCTFMITGCEGDPIAPIPMPEGALPTTYSPTRVIASSFSEFGTCTGIPVKELETCKDALAEAQARITALEKERDQVTGAALTMAAATQESLERSRRRIAELEGELSSAKATVAELQQVSKQEKGRAEGLQLQALESEQELTRRKAALADTTRHLTGLEQDKQKAAMALAEAQAQAQQLAAGLATEQAKTAGLLDDNNRLALSLASLQNSFKAEIEKRDVLIRESRGQLVITILDRLLFDSGQTAIKPTAIKNLHEVSAVLKTAADKEIRIEGHTDDRPIRGSLGQRFPSNWELSTARATSVVRYLVDNEGIDAPRVSAVGYADTRPVASNTTEEGRSRNRRIEILLYPKTVVREPG